MSADSSSVLLYTASIAPLFDPERYAEAFRLASRARQAKVERLRLMPDRCRSLAAELLLHRALRDWGVQPPYEPEQAPGGKPQLPGGPKFSLSHSGDYALCAVSEANVGCDIEQIHPVRHALAERFFCPEEAAEIAAAGSEEARTLRFFRLWTLKESYEKAIGLGLGLPMNAFRLQLEPAPALVFSPESADFAFQEFSQLPDYCCSLAVQLEHPVSELTVLTVEQLLT